MEKVLVTGIGGQLGSEIAKQLLKKDYFVVGYDNFSTGSVQNIDNEVLNHKDIVITDKLECAISFKYDYIIHCAALANIVDSIKKPSKYIDSNVFLTSVLLQFSKDINIKKFIYCASSSCYGDKVKTPTDENQPIDCKYPYALSKYMGEQLVINFGKLYRIPYISFRIFNIYSPYIKKGTGYGSVLKCFARAYLENILEKKPLIMIGDGTQKRDFLHVSDCARALIMGMESDIANEIFNLGGGNPQSINYLIELMFGKNYPRKEMPLRKGEPLITHADITKIKEVLGWEPKISFEDGIKEVMRNIENYRDFPYFDAEKYREVHKDWELYL